MSELPARRLYIAVGACAVVVYLGALWNHFAFDDTLAVVSNSLVHHWSGLWRAFAHSYYWPVEPSGRLYRPLVAATFTLDWQVDHAAWFHAVNLMWHAGASVTVAALVRRWAGSAAALIGGLLFAVHPVHVEAVAYVVGRAELMAGLFAMLAVYAALEHGSVAWCAGALVLAVLSKENAAVAPALIVWAWLVGLRPVPPRPRLRAFVASWILIAVLYAVLRWAIIHTHTQGGIVAPVFVGESPVAVRLTAIAALADVGRLLVFPLQLRADYSPAERTIVTSAADPRFLLGMAVVAIWGALLWLAWRRHRRLEAFGLGWIAITYAPVANLLFPIGILIAERTLYLPSAGLAMVVGGLARKLPRAYWAGLMALLAAGAVRTALRVPMWRDEATVTLGMIQDSPRSYVAMARAGLLFQRGGQTGRALEAYRRAIDDYDRDPMVFLAAADAAWTARQPALADSMLHGAAQVCGRCEAQFQFQIAVARARGDSGVADSLARHARRQHGARP